MLTQGSCKSNVRFHIQYYIPIGCYISLAIQPFIQGKGNQTWHRSYEQLQTRTQRGLEVSAQRIQRSYKQMNAMRNHHIHFFSQHKPYFLDYS